MASFYVRVPAGCRYEVAFATDPRLLSPTFRSRRRPENFGTSGAQGLLVAPGGRGVYVIAPQVLGRFAGARRLYYTLGAYTPDRQAFFSTPLDQLEGAPFLRISADFRARAPRFGRAARHKFALGWGGDCVRPAARGRGVERARGYGQAGWSQVYLNGRINKELSYEQYKTSITDAQLGPASDRGGTELPVYESELTTDDLRQIYPTLATDQQSGKLTSAQLENYTEELNYAFFLIGLNTVEAQAAYLGHAAVEAAGFRIFTESQNQARQVYEDDPAAVRLDVGYLNGDAQQHAAYRMGGPINPGHDTSWQQTFIGRGPLQVTTRINYIKTLAFMEALSQRYTSVGMSDEASRLMEAFAAVRQHPREAARPRHTFIFSAAYMKMGEGDLHILSASSNPSFNGTQPESNPWMTGGSRETSQKAAKKASAFGRAVDALNAKL